MSILFLAHKQNSDKIKKRKAFLLDKDLIIIPHNHITAGPTVAAGKCY